MAKKQVITCNVSNWIEENKQFFVPPVCNKLMHTNGQIDVMFVGGPNSRKDYHIEGGEELFLQIKGDMVLKVVERGQHKDISIKEGEIFLLPRAIPHSPQRFSNTVGLVIERRRHELESDALRFFTESEGKLQLETLYEVWFTWGKESMPDLFDQFFKSEQNKTGKPIPGTISSNPPIVVDSKTSLYRPFSLMNWVEENRTKIDTEGKVYLFDPSKHQIQVYVCGNGQTSDYDNTAEIWIWQLKGDSILKYDRENKTLSNDDSALLPVGTRFTLQQKKGSMALVCYQDPTRSSHYPGNYPD